MTDVDLSDWLTKQQAADVIGVSTKAIERWAQAGKLEKRSRPQARGPHVAVYFPDDVAKLAAERRPAAAPFVLPAVPTSHDQSVNGNGSAIAATRTLDILNPAHDDPIRQLFAAALRAVMSQTSQTSAASETVFVTIHEAATITGLSQAYLRRQVDAGTLKAVRDRGWRIRRKDLEAL